MAFYLLIILAGLGAVVWLFLNENQKEKSKKQPNLLDRLGLNNQDKPQPTKNLPLDIPSPKDLSLEKMGVFAQNTDTKSQEFTDMEESSNLEHKLYELKVKYEKLDALFKEKSADLEKKEDSLEIELKAKKEFNKVKDLLEKEIKDKKDENHKLQLELNANQVEMESYKKRIAQLEEKIRSKEQAMKEQEKQMANLTKEMQDLTSKLAVVQASKLQTVQSSPQPSQPSPTVPTVIETKTETTVTKKPLEPPSVQTSEQVPVEPSIVEPPKPQEKSEPEKEKPISNETTNQPPSPPNS